VLLAIYFKVALKNSLILPGILIKIPGKSGNLQGNF